MAAFGNDIGVRIAYGSTGFDRVHRQQNALTQSARRLGGATRAMSGDMTALDRTMNRFASLAGLTLAIHKVIALSDSFVNMQNRLNVTADSTDRMVHSLGALSEIAKKSRTDLITNVEVFSRFALAGKQQGFTTNQLLVATESLSKAVTISGATTSEAQGAFIQLSQAFGSTQLRGQELTSVLEQIPRAAQAIAESLNIPIGKLREFGMEGKITSQDILRALIESSAKLEAEFSRTVSTFSQAVVVLTNELRVNIGAAAEASGLIDKLVKSTTFLSEEVVPIAARSLAEFGQAFDDISDSVNAVSDIFSGIQDGGKRAAETVTNISSAIGDMIAFLRNGTMTDGPIRFLPEVDEDPLTVAGTKIRNLIFLMESLDESSKTDVQKRIDTLTNAFQSGKLGVDEYAVSLTDLVKVYDDLSVENIPLQVQMDELREQASEADSLIGELRTIASGIPDFIVNNRFLIPLPILRKQVQDLKKEQDAYINTLYDEESAAKVVSSALAAYTLKQKQLEAARKDVQRGIEALPPGLNRLNFALGETASKGFQQLIDRMDAARGAASDLRDSFNLLAQASQLGGRQGVLDKFGFDIGGTQDISFAPANPLNLTNQQLEVVGQEQRRILNDTYEGVVSQMASAVSSANEDFDMDAKKREIDEVVDAFGKIPANVISKLDNGPQLKAIVDAMGVDGLKSSLKSSLSDVSKDVNDFAENVSQIVFDADPLGGAVFEIQEKIGTLTQALVSGNPELAKYGIGTEQITNAIRVLGQQLTDPLDKMKELGERVQGYAQVAFPAQAASRELADQLADLNVYGQSAGHTILGMARSLEAAAIGAELTRLHTEELNEELIKLQDQFRELSADPMDELNKVVAAGTQLLAEGKIGWDDYMASIMEAQRQADSFSRSFDAGARRAIQGLAEEYTNGGAQIEGVLVNAFRSAEDALVSFVQTGKFNFSDMIDSIIADLARLAIQRAILEPLTNLFGFAIPGGSFATQAVTSVVGGSPASFSAASTAAPVGMTVAPQINVTVNAQSGSDPAAIGQETAKAVQKAVEATTRAIVRDEVQRMARPGGQANNRLLQGI